MIVLPASVAAFVQSTCEAGHVVWLIGSQANATARTDSDWDLLVFGNQSLFEGLELLEPVDSVDLLVVHDGNAFRSPWNRTTDGAVKSGSLSGWSWQELSSTKATYEGTKLPNVWGSLKALRLQPSHCGSTRRSS